jgi:Predicted membrane protein
MTSLPFQMLIYFHSFYSLFYACTVLPLFWIAPPDVSVPELERVLKMIFFFLWLAVEPLRMYFGWMGNLRELVWSVLRLFSALYCTVLTHPATPG